MRRAVMAMGGVVLMATVPAGSLAASADGGTSSIDLAQFFKTRSPWRFTASQGPDWSSDFAGFGESKVPGAISLCISADRGRTCRPDLRHLLRWPSEKDDASADVHYVNYALIVRPFPGRALLLLQVSGLNAATGGHRVATAAFAYSRAADTFVPAYYMLTGSHNDQEVRYIAEGPLKASIISVEPTGDAPFGFWVTVNRLGPDNRYRPVLHYRSATRYGDGNSLAVIDSEMPNIHRRLGLRRPGARLPLPKGGCQKPRLVRNELWCR